MPTLDAPPTTYPVGAFRQAGWAFLFLGLTVGPAVRLGNENFVFDLLPDFVGYLMIAAAANRLVVVHRRARAVRNLALVSAFLAIPSVAQYTVVTPPAGGVTTWTAPLWPLTIVQGLLELALVWVLCGLVADLARRAGDEVTRRRAEARRGVYVALRVALTAAVGLGLLGRAGAVPVLALAGAGLVVGLLLMGLMMGLLFRADRRCRRWLELAPPPDEPMAAARPGGAGFRLLFLAGALLPVALAVGAFWYYLEWQEARDEARARTSSSAAYEPARAAFYGDLLAGRVDEAYESTTTDFKTRVSRAQFADLAARYVAFVNRGDDRGGAAGSGSGPDYVTEYREKVGGDGTAVRATITIRRDRDSILTLTPPPLKVDEFRVEEGPARQGPWFGGRPGGGR
jgi:hypothetical protein